MIVRNAEPTIERCLDSVVRPTVPRLGGPAFDEIVIVDTGSNDQTRSIVAGFGMKQRAMGGRFVHDVIPWPNHFGKARQASFEAASCEWRGWIDADDILEGAAYLKPTLEAHLRIEHGAVVLPYLYAVDKDGRVITRLLRERFVRWPDGWAWYGAVHEHLMRIDRGSFRALRISDNVQVRHLASVEEISSRVGRNVSLLDADGADNPAERQRVLYQLAEVARATDPERALEILAEALALPYQDQITRVLCHYLSADLHANSKRWEKSREHGMRIIELAPHLRTGYQALGNTYFLEGRMGEAATWFWLGFSQARPDEEALAIDDSEDAVIAAVAIEQAGGPERETRFAKILADYPHLERASAVQAAKARIRTTKMQRSFPNVISYYIDHDEFEKAHRLSRTLAYTCKRSPEVALLRREVRAYLEAHGSILTDIGWAPLPLDAQAHVNEVVFERARWAVAEIARLGWRRVVSFGCCDGFIEGYCAAHLPEVEFLGYDHSPKAIEHARRVWSLPNLRFTKDWPGHDGFDGAICFEVIEHLQGGPMGDLIRGQLPALYTTPAMQPDGGAPHDRFHIGTAGHLRIFTLPEIRRNYAPEAAQLLDEGRVKLWAFRTPERRSHHGQNHRLVVFVCAGAPFAWGPESAHTKGLTGSEECVLYLAEALAQTGTTDVVVAVDPLAGSERIVNRVHWVGLEYLAELDLDAEEYAETNLILWRAPTGATQPLVKTLSPMVRRILWLHDATYGPVPPEVWTQYDKIICATQYHARIIAAQYPAAAAGIDVIEHGIPAMPKREKDFSKAIYASSPDRGLVRLLTWWPAVKQEYPDLHLHVFYGRGNMRALADYYPGLHTQIAEVEKLLKECAALDVHDHGLVSHEELHEHFATAALWLYPTTFEEIACLTAMKAQAAGAMPVFSHSGCLTETVRTAVPFWTHPETIDTDEARAAFIENIGQVRPGRQPLAWPSWADRAKEWLTVLDALGSIGEIAEL